MVCLQRTFEGTNLPAVIHKIVQVTFAPVKGDYSEGLKQMVMTSLLLIIEYMSDDGFISINRL